MRILVPDSSFKYHKKHFEELWKILPEDGKTMKVDSLHGFESLDYHNSGKGLPYCTADGSWELDTGVYDLPEKLDYLPSQMRSTLERTVANQQLKYLIKMDCDGSKQANDLYDFVHQVHHIKSPNHNIGEFS